MELTNAAVALAQFHSVEHDRLAIGVSVGAASNDDRNSGHFGLDFEALLEKPVVPTWRLRVELGQSRWLFDKQQAAPPSPPSDTVTLTRLTAGAIHAGPLFSGLPTFYVGGGIGVYHYRFDLGSAPNPTQAGIYGVGGSRSGRATSPSAPNSTCMSLAVPGVARCFPRCFFCALDFGGHKGAVLTRSRPTFNHLRSYGWMRSTVKAGDTFSCTGGAAKSGKPAMLSSLIDVPDGRKIKSWRIRDFDLAHREPQRDHHRARCGPRRPREAAAASHRRRPQPARKK